MLQGVLDRVLTSNGEDTSPQVAEAAQARAAAERRLTAAEAARAELEGVVRTKNSLVMDLQRRLDDTAAAAADAMSLSAGGSGLGSAVSPTLH